ncbi:HNH endonuclease [Sphingomonas sp. MMS24-J45]|uniref:HNH endonuclease n=1 Tax=Sphingomonas sp. MMS24-J45 TaxID=3238806 RepID=UPI00384B010C
MSARRAWSLLTIDGTRQYGGNTGYEDNPASVYRYDSDVANHLQVQAGDVVIVRSRMSVIGIAEIETIEEGTGHKDRLRCPQCRATNIKRRAKKLPAWSCKFGHAFDEPLNEPVAVTTFAAHYGATFVPAGSGLSVVHLHEAVLRPSDQMSIKEIDLAKLEPVLGSGSAINALVRRFARRLTVPEIAQGSSDADGSIVDARRRIMREIAMRRGQARFRARLIRRYGAQCQISGCKFPGLVEAAHIRAYSVSEDNGPGNGLLLRSDLHTLFDLGLLGIEPASLRIALHPALQTAGYAEFADRVLFVNGSGGPSREALHERWQFFSAHLPGASPE